MVKRKVLDLKKKKVSLKKQIQKILALVINQNLLEKEDQIDHQEMVKRKVLDLKKKKVSLKKMIQNQPVLQITQNTLVKNH